ncbi:hypothetical protein IYV58_11940 [Klebsiella sp. BDA134-6]|uniref:T6SS immunity protein Tli4 family protein n=1 Tax=Klebsiella sp. BDA134-6 TaxID=2787706 RepID=UPI00189F36A2|nr:T6SS immunity protein Tli4 family protein [Klebsiella sp. BDA134-6]QPF29934.1 hypothetical protein IYV58_11940 [Klebsiella sp. BDA134-6]
MKGLPSLVILGCLVYSDCIIAQEWKGECIGYYQLLLPDGLEVALYPVNLIIDPLENPAWQKNTLVSRYLFPKISFGENRYQSNGDTVQAQFSVFHYADYDVVVSSENKSTIDLLKYEKEFKERTDNRIQDYWDKRNHKLSMKLPVLPKDIAERSLAYSIDNYDNAFSATDSGGYSLFVNNGNRLFIFKKADKVQSLDEQLNKSRPEMLSLLKRFQPRKLYEVPEKQGFCLPYGFIAGDSGHEKRNMAVTYRLKNHPDVTIFFQDLGMMNPQAGEEDDLNEKDYMAWLWSWDFQAGATSKELIKPKWRSIKMDGRDGTGTFVKGTYKNVPVYDYKGHVSNRLNYINYGYAAYVQGNHKARNLEPDLLLYVMQDSRRLKNQPPMDKDEIEKMAEHIISSIKRR